MKKQTIRRCIKGCAKTGMVNAELSKTQLKKVRNNGFNVVQESRTPTQVPYYTVSWNISWTNKLAILMHTLRIKFRHFISRIIGRIKGKR